MSARFNEVTIDRNVSVNYRKIFSEKPHVVDISSSVSKEAHIEIKAAKYRPISKL